MSEKYEAPGQINSAKGTATNVPTDKDGLIYGEGRIGARENLTTQGSMGFEKNQSATKMSMTPPEVELGTMGQHKLQRVKSSDAGSHAI